MKTMTIFIRSNGCPGRDLDAARLVAYFEANGYKILSSPKKADYILFVACSFKESRKDDSFRYLEKIKHYPGKIIMAGCLPEIATQEFKHKFKGEFISTKKIDQIDSLFPDHTIRFHQISDVNFLFPKLCLLTNKILSEFEFSRKFFKQVTSVKLFSGGKGQIPYLRVGHGCNESCTYCGISKAIGSLKSKPIALVKNEYKALLQKNHRYFKFFADNLGAYGLDINSTLPQLFDALSQMDKGLLVKWLMIHLDPKWAILYQEELLPWIENRKIDEILCAIQSASPRILKAMNRPSDTKAMEECFLKFRDANSALKLNTAFIVGFPSETIEDVNLTLEFIKRVRFDVVLPFQYFASPGTLAATMPDQINKQDLTERMLHVKEALDKSKIRWVEL